MKMAVIKTGGKQYLVKEKDKIKMEKIPSSEGKSIEFKEVLLISDNKELKIGRPRVSGAKVTAKILKQGRTKKNSVIKYKSKTRYQRTLGQRQHFTEVEVEKII